MTKPSGAQRLREWMKKHGKKQKDFAAMIGSHQASVSTWLQGRAPSLAMALRIRAATRIPVEAWDRAQEEDATPRSA